MKLTFEKIYNGAYELFGHKFRQNCYNKTATKEHPISFLKDLKDGDFIDIRIRKGETNANTKSRQK